MGFTCKCKFGAKSYIEEKFVDIFCLILRLSEGKVSIFSWGLCHGYSQDL